MPARPPKRDHTGRTLPVARPDGVVGDGLLLRDGEQIERGIFGATLNPAVERQVHGYRPMKSPWRELWPLIQEFVVRIVLAIRPPTVQSSRHSMIAVSRLSGWAVQRGLELDEETVFHPLRIEEFTAWTADTEASFRSNMRSRLRAIAREVTRDAPWLPEPTRLASRTLKPPYTALEVDLLAEDIARQARVTRRAAEAMHNLGLGAGLKAKALRAVTAAHIVQVHGVWCVVVERPDASHQVPILLQYVEPVRELAARYPTGPLLHENAHRKNVGEMVHKFRPGPCTPWPNTWRYRSTWLVSHLVLGTRIDLVIDAAGVREQQGLVDLLAYMPPVDPPSAMQILAGGRP